VPTVAEYEYIDKDGNVCGKVERVEPGRDGRRKEFFPHHFDGSKFVLGLNGKQFPLYHADEVAQAIADGQTVFVVEGEGKADALRAALRDAKSRAAVTTIAGGCKAPLRDEHVAAFDGAPKVVFVADSDEPGRASAAARADVIARRYPQTAVQVIDLFPDRHPAKDKKTLDVADWLHEGHKLRELAVIIAAAPRVEPPPGLSLLAVDSTAKTSAEWGVFLSIDSVPHPKPLPLGLVPQAYRDFVFDISDRMCVPPEFIAVPQMIATAAVVGRKILIQPEPGNPWKEAPNLWGMLVAEPGMLKSPAQAEAFASMRRLATERRKTFDVEATTLKERQQLAKLKVEALEQSYRQSMKANTETVDIEADLQAHRAVLEERAIERRYFTHDATTEKLGEILRDNPQGVLQVRDELSGFFASMERAGREGDRAFYLEAWNGKDPFTVDRISRGTIHIPALCLLNFGTIQPGPLRQFIADAIRGGAGADGLVQRYALAVICLTPPTYKKCVRPQDHDARARVDTVFDDLDELEFTAEGESHVVGFSTAAQLIFDEWRTDLEARIRVDSESSAFRAWLAKQRKTIPALALLFHLIAESGTGRMLTPVSEEALLAACGWGQILESHARHIYGGAVASPAMILAAKIQRGDLADGTSVRDLKRRKWSGLTTALDVDSSVDELAELGWLRLEDRTTGGRGQVIRLHPDLRGAR
jgi:hypothetical protein